MRFPFGCFLVLFLSITALSQAPESLVKCWSVENQEISSSEPASDNERLFVSTTSGSLLAINNETGAITWEAELSGSVGTFIFPSQGSVFVGASFGEDEGSSSGFLSGTNSVSGVPFFRVQTGGLRSILVAEDAVYAVSDRGIVQSYSKDGKNLRWSTDLRVAPTSNLVSHEGNLLFANDSNSLVLVDQGDGSIVKQLNTGEAASRVFPMDDYLVLGTATGAIKALSWSGESIWENFTGGGISDIELAGSNLLVSSKDNFVYSINAGNGKKEWKRKLAGRILGSAFVTADLRAYTTTGSNTALLLSVSDGAIVGKVELSERFLTRPVSIKDGFAVITEAGVDAFRLNGCSNEKGRSSERPDASLNERDDNHSSSRKSHL